MTIACAMLDFPENRETCREMIEDVYYLCDLACNDKNKAIVQSYYQSKFNENLPTY